MHRMRMIGSGAAEAIPSPMCRCPICEGARLSRGKDIRSRSCFRVNPALQIDFGPDQFYQSVVLGNDLTTLTDLLITHTHADHLAFPELDMRAMALVGAEQPVNVYVSRAGCEWLSRATAPYEYSSLSYEPCYRLVPVDYYQPFTAGGLNVMPLKGNHSGYGEGESSVNYLIGLPTVKRFSTPPTPAISWRRRLNSSGAFGWTIWWWRAPSAIRPSFGRSGRKGTWAARACWRCPGVF